MGKNTKEDEQNVVRVSVRIRPLSKIEEEDQEDTCVKLIGPNTIDFGTNKRYLFDSVHSPLVSQENFFNLEIEPLIEKFLEGDNVSILAYGQTGSGKTYTMGLNDNSVSNVEMDSLISDDETNSNKDGSKGLIPRICDVIFKVKNETSQNDPEQKDMKVEISYLEVYREKIRDLLSTSDLSSKGLNIRETKRGRIVVQGLSFHEAINQKEALDLLEIGSTARSTGETKMNESSSRSHALFTIYLYQENRTTGLKIVSKLHLVDLAGSERNKRTGSVGVQFTESIRINQGLLALGNVINALSAKRKGHVPYRQSKLTRLLQDSLGGNSKTLFIACLSPAGNSFQESLNTLKYATRAGDIVNLSANGEVFDFTDEYERLNLGLLTTKPKILEKLSSSSYSLGMIRHKLSSLLDSIDVKAETKLNIKQIISSLDNGCQIKEKVNSLENMRRKNSELFNVIDELKKKQENFKNEKQELTSQVSLLQHQNRVLTKDLEIQEKQSLVSQIKPTVLDQGISCGSVLQEENLKVKEDFVKKLKMEENKSHSGDRKIRQLTKENERLKKSLKDKLLKLRQEEEKNVHFSSKSDQVHLQTFIQTCLTDYNNMMKAKKDQSRNEELSSRINEREKELQNIQSENMSTDSCEGEVKSSCAEELREEIDHLKAEAKFRTQLLKQRLLTPFDDIVEQAFTKSKMKVNYELFACVVKEHVELIVEAKTIRFRKNNLQSQVKQLKLKTGSLKVSLLKARRSQHAFALENKDLITHSPEKDKENSPLQTQNGKIKPRKVKISRKLLREIKL